MPYTGTIKQAKRLKHLLLLLCILLSACSTYLPSQARLTPHYASIPDGRIEYYRFGHGSPIILIAGYATDVTSWNREFLAELATQHQLIVMNNRGVGGSVVTSNRYDSRDLANDVYHVIESLHLKNTSIIGISMGGMIAQQLAVLHPQHVKHLVLINTAMAGHQAVHPDPEMEATLLNIPNDQLGFYFVAVNSFFPANWKLKMGYALAVDRFQPSHYVEINLSKITPKQRQLILNWSKDETTAHKMRQLKMPVLILNGSADRVIPPINSTILAQTIPDARLVHWKQGGHAMIYQYPKEMAEVILTFIAS